MRGHADHDESAWVERGGLSMRRCSGRILLDRLADEDENNTKYLFRQPFREFGMQRRPQSICGRGAAGNPKNRFERLEYVRDDGDGPWLTGASVRNTLPPRKRRNVRSGESGEGGS